MKVRDVMTEEVVTVGPDTPMRVVGMLMFEYGLSGVPVVADDGSLLGVVSEADIASEARFPSRTAADAMTAAATIPPYAQVSEAAAKMIASERPQLVVVSGGEVEGIVTPADLTRSLSRQDELLAATR